jgi:RNA polymerase sigma-70 factor (ECF subfamily)
VETQDKNLISQTMLPIQVRRYARQWFVMAWRVLRDVDAAEDVCQQAVLKACQHQDGWRDIQTFRGWMSRVVTNEAIDELRRRQRDREFHQKAAHHHTGATRGGHDQDLALREALQAAMDRLPPETREVAVLRLVAGLNGSETAEAVSVSEATVSRRLHEAMDSLREQLHDWQPLRKV